MDQTAITIIMKIQQKLPTTFTGPVAIIPMVIPTFMDQIVVTTIAINGCHCR
jgi:hypothetical protein